MSFTIVHAVLDKLFVQVWFWVILAGMLCRTEACLLNRGAEQRHRNSACCRRWLTKFFLGVTLQMQLQVMCFVEVSTPYTTIRVSERAYPETYRRQGDCWILSSNGRDATAMRRACLRLPCLFYVDVRGGTMKARWKIPTLVPSSRLQFSWSRGAAICGLILAMSVVGN